ncbi:DUF3168 domain-containing protein [Bacillus sp. OK048]|uniref:DUF3168 domain-containing protein n=1 Tax=Bacillus sp. OK048 TaxID=1882761 RepID=UPI0008853F50|nr:DUF3168 domain-containing protein [Bacillus sp. OK048]SDM17419.1 hypothetical protein SAMN05443253_102167 [Bacillus sp. OK048]
MDFEEALRAELGTIAGLTNKVFPLNATEGTKAPYIIYVSSEGVQDKSLLGYLSSKEVDCEINIVQASYGSMKSLTKLVISQIISFIGRNIGENGPFIQNVTYHKPVELYEQEVNLYRCVIDCNFKF